MSARSPRVTGFDIPKTTPAPPDEATDIIQELGILLHYALRADPDKSLSIATVALVDGMWRCVGECGKGHEVQMAGALMATARDLLARVGVEVHVAGIDTSELGVKN